MGVRPKNVFIFLLFIFLSLQLTIPANNEIEYLNNQENESADFQSGAGGIKGVVLDEKSKALFSANIILVGTTFGAATNFEGKFRIDHIPTGIYKVQVSYVGYTKEIVEIEIVENRIVQLDFMIKPESFSVGGIIVTAKEDLLPRDIATKTEISSGEIEHYQATNLGDVLDLVPGV